MGTHAKHRNIFKLVKNSNTKKRKKLGGWVRRFEKSICISPNRRDCKVEIPLGHFDWKQVKSFSIVIVCPVGLFDPDAKVCLLGTPLSSRISFWLEILGRVQNFLGSSPMSILKYVSLPYPKETLAKRKGRNFQRGGWSNVGCCSIRYANFEIILIRLVKEGFAFSELN